MYGLKAESMVEDRHGSKANLSINKLLEVEEHVWSPMYGLKGNVDATVQVVYNDDTDNSQKTLTIPLEVKTGKKDTSHSHRAQTALYTLLLSDRYGKLSHRARNRSVFAKLFFLSRY